MRRAVLTPEILDIEIQQTVRSPINETFRAMTTPRLVDDWGGGPARIQARVNGKWSLWDGDMFGVVKEVEYPRRMVHTLRELIWDDSYLDSLVYWELAEAEYGTRISLVHTGLPTRKIREQHHDGWYEYFLGPLKAYLEYRTTRKK